MLNENTQVKASNGGGTLGEYFYDGDGRRVKKVVPDTGETTIFVYDAGGKLVAEYSTIVEPVQTAKVAYLTNDHLGSPRINTDGSGNVVARHDYHPFGEEIDGTGGRTTGLGYPSGSDGIRKQFTGYERDNETDLDFAQARMYSKNLGRFYSVDPENFGAFEENPQSWNGYSYALNNPAIFTDPEGLDVQYCVSGEECVTLSKEETKALFDKKYQASLGNTVKNGRVTDSDGNVIATYRDERNTARLLGGFRPIGEAALPILEALTPTPIPGLTMAGPIIKGSKVVIGGGTKLHKVAPAAQGLVKLTRSGKRQIGNLAKHKDELVKDVHKARGGKAGSWNAIDAVENGVDYREATLGEVANAAGKGVEAAKRVLKQVKDAERLAGKH